MAEEKENDLSYLSVNQKFFVMERPPVLMFRLYEMNYGPTNYNACFSHFPFSHVTAVKINISYEICLLNL